MQTLMPFDDFTWSVRCLDDDILSIQREDTLQIMHHLLIDGGGAIADNPAVRMWEGYERALLAYQQATCHEWSSVRGFEDRIWESTRFMFLDVVVDPMATPLIPPPWMGDVDFHISHQSRLLRINQEYYRKHFPGIRDDHEIVWPSNLYKEKA